MNFHDTNKERVRRIQEAGDILQLLSYYGYEVHVDYDREQQFRCDLHGDGSDAKPSARAYPLTNSWYCWACGESRDLIKTYMAKENVPFSNACYALEKEYGLSHLWYEETPTKVEYVDYSVRTWDREKTDTRKLLSSAHEEDSRALHSEYSDPLFTPVEYYRLWEVFDMICWQVRSEEWREEKGGRAMIKLREKFNSSLKGRLCSI